MELKKGILNTLLKILEIDKVISSDEIDGLLLKKMAKSNIIRNNRPNGDTGKQTHIAITSKERVLFPMVSNVAYYEGSEETKFYDMRLPVTLVKQNIEKMDIENQIKFDDEYLETETLCYMRKGQGNIQVQISKTNSDKKDFIEFRKLIFEDDYLCVIKKKGEFKFFFLAFKKELKDQILEIFDTEENLVFIDNKSVTEITKDVIVEEKQMKSPLSEEQVLILALYLSKFSEEALNYLEVKTWKEAYIRIAERSKEYSNPKSINNLKDHYDPYFDNGRKGWHQKPLIPKYKNILDQFKNLKRNEFEKIISLFWLEERSRLNKHHNRIIYGAPGTGKSFKLQENLEKCLISKANYNRVTFYPGFSYGQFVGNYKPKPDVGNNITYEYTPGIFMKTLVSALENPSEDYVLVIEEINRSKADSVFGDVFQILDRNNEGESEYGITPSEEILKYLSDKTDIKIESKEDYELKIPSNMYIWATMNSADQGVYPMDTAFKRRWTFEHIGLNENENKFCGLYSNDHSDYLISYKNKTEDGEKNICYVAWNDFRRSINSILLNSSNISEDRLLAPFFIKENDFYKAPYIIDGNEKYIIKLESFQSKILMYLFDDLLRHKKNSEIFNDKINSFSELKDGNELNCIFHSTLLSKLEICPTFHKEILSE